MAINFELLDTVHKFIDTHPQAHYQGRYAMGKLVSSPDQYDESICGSTGCIAGWAAVFDGWEQTGTSPEIVTKGNRELSMHIAGQISLGLTGEQAENLFAGGNSRQGIDDMIAALHANPDADLNYEWARDSNRR